MTTNRCVCGFIELPDEHLTDHLEAVFILDDVVGANGQVHEEAGSLTCRCGYAAGTTAKLDAPPRLLHPFQPDRPRRQGARA